MTSDVRSGQPLPDPSRSPTPNARAADGGDVMLPGCRWQRVRSAHTGRDYRIFSCVPRGEAPSPGHPVIYLLDGNLLFPTAVTLLRMAEHAARRLGIDSAPPALVAIGHDVDGALHDPARNEDYTPPAPDLSDTGDRSGSPQGGAERFLDFIEHELKPLIAGQMAIDPARQALVGHSYGGLLALHTLFTRRALFQTYVAGSPSIWWNNGFILGEKAAFLARYHTSANADASAVVDDDNATPTSRARTRLLLTVGELEQTPTRHLDGTQRDPVIHARRMVDNARDLAAELSALPTEYRLDVAFRELAGVNHIGAALPMLGHAFEFIRLGHGAGAADRQRTAD